MLPSGEHTGHEKRRIDIGDFVIPGALASAHFHPVIEITVLLRSVIAQEEQDAKGKIVSFFVRHPAAHHRRRKAPDSPKPIEAMLAISPGALPSVLPRSGIRPVTGSA